GSALCRHLARADLGDRMVRRRRRGADHGHHVGRALGGLLLPTDHCAEGAAGADPRRFHLDTRRYRWRADHWHRREARRVLLGSGGRGRHRELARLRDRAWLSHLPAAGAVRRKDHRADLNMLYREVGQYKTIYAADMAVFPILQDRIGIAVILLVAFVVLPLNGNDFLLNTVMIPFLIFSLAAIGLNLLTGYAGLLSLGTGAFMGVGAYACLKLTTFFPQVNIVIWIIASGLFSAAVGALFGLPSLRIKGFYLAVATLAAQFFLEWCFIRVPWLYNHSVSGAIEVPLRKLAGVPVTGPTATSLTRYLVVLSIVVVMTWVASNLVRGRIGRMWMSVRDMDLAAELVGIRLLRTKLLAFAVSSFYCGVAGAMMVFLWYGG